jgi:peptidoglycan/xylan/chitin deacetylase (PgdA/CDA1 family)
VTRVAVALAAASLLAGCAGGGSSPGLPAATPPATEATPSAAASPQPTIPATPAPSQTPTPAPTAFGGAVATASCRPDVVPDAAFPRPAVQPAAGAAPLYLRVPILEYHRVVPMDKAGKSEPGLTMPPEVFKAELDGLLAAGWHTISLTDLANGLDAGAAPPPHSFVITLDDGWLDGFEYAYPILADHGYTATFFVIADRIGRPDFMGPVEIRALAQAGYEIGDHSWHHDALTSITGKPLASEIATGAATIAAIAGRWPEAFAYPRGKFDPQVMAAVAACKSLRIAVTEGGGGREMWSNRFRIARIQVGAYRSAESLLHQVQSVGV